MVPEGWTERPLDDLTAQSVTYGVVKPGDERTGGIPFVRGGDFPDGHIRIGNLRTISPEISAGYKRTVLRGGEILVSLVGYPGATAVVPEELAGANIARQAALVRPNGKVHRDYLFQFLRSPIGQKRMLAQSLGSAQQVINLKDLKSVAVAIPPLPEQRKIADILSTWDQAIETTEALLATARTQKRALMQFLLTGKRRFPEFEGQEWQEVRLGDLFTERSERGGDNLPLLAITGGRGVIPQSETDRRDKSREDKSTYKQIHPGDIGYNSMRMWQGVSALSSLSGLVSPAYTIVKPGPEIDAGFVAHLFKLPRQVHLFRRYSQGLTSDTWNLKFKQFAEVPTRIPSVPEQLMIAEVLDSQDAEIANLETHADKLRTEKKALMQQLLTGKRRVVVE